MPKPVKPPVWPPNNTEVTGIKVEVTNTPTPTNPYGSIRISFDKTPAATTWWISMDGTSIAANHSNVLTIWDKNVFDYNYVKSGDHQIFVACVINQVLGPFSDPVPFTMP